MYDISDKVFYTGAGKPVPCTVVDVNPWDADKVTVRVTKAMPGWGRGEMVTTGPEFLTPR
jgi:hypothetical protein